MVSNKTALEIRNEQKGEAEADRGTKHTNDKCITNCVLCRYIKYRITTETPNVQHEQTSRGRSRKQLSN